MADRTETAEPAQGIFEPKPDLTPPESGAHKAKRLIIVIAVLVIAGILLFSFRDPYMKPVKTFYRHLEAGDYSGMTKAFPSWLVKADQGEGNVTVTDMCAAVYSAVRASFPTGDIQPKIEEKAAITEERLAKIQSGIEAQYGISVKVTAGWNCRFSVQYRESGTSGASLTRTEYVRIYKINGKWVFIDVPNDQG